MCQLLTPPNEKKAMVQKIANVIRHVLFEDLGSLEHVLINNHYDICYWDAGVDDIRQLLQLPSDLLVVLGGPIGVYEQAIYPFLADEITLLQQRLNADLPTLGICLGAQLMAAALGAKVYGGHGKEIGWSPLIKSPHTPPLFDYLFKDNIKVLHWHGDTFDLPNGAIHLASSHLYQHQAFLWQKNGLALQCHLEVQHHTLERWLIGHASELAAVKSININTLRQENQQYAPLLASAIVPFWQAWLDSLSV